MRKKVNNMKSIYIEEKYLVINEEAFIYIYGGNLRYIDNKGERFEIKEDINVNDIRRMISIKEIPYSEVKKSFFKREIFYFHEQDKILKIRSKDIKSAYIRYSYKKEYGFLSFEKLKKRLSDEEYTEFYRNMFKKYGLVQ